MTSKHIDFELASVLFNVGAVYSILGAKEERSSSESLRLACQSFQKAAWAFHTAPDLYPDHMKEDMAMDVMAVLAQVGLIPLLSLSSTSTSLNNPR